MQGFGSSPTLFSWTCSQLPPVEVVVYEKRLKFNCVSAASGPGFNRQSRLQTWDRPLADRRRFPRSTAEIDDQDLCLAPGSFLSRKGGLFLQGERHPRPITCGKQPRSLSPRSDRGVRRRWHRRRPPTRQCEPTLAAAAAAAPRRRRIPLPTRGGGPADPAVAQRP